MTPFGHDEQWRQWRSALSADRMHHGWLLAGREGLGQGEFAQRAARELVGTDDGLGGLSGQGGQPMSDSAHHPDIITISRQPKDDKEAKKRDEGKPFETRRNITVDQIRAMQRKLTTRPTMGSRRAIILDTADDLETGASNALLKSLEEPPQGTIFMLVANHPARLLPTIRSRCRVLRFKAWQDENIAKLLAEHMAEIAPEIRDNAVVASRGSPGAALAFIDQDLFPIFRAMDSILRDGDPDFVQRGALPQLIGARPKRDRIIAILDLARSAVANAISQTATCDYPALAQCHAELVELSAQAPTLNFDPGILIVKIGGLLASAAPHKDHANV